MHFVNVQRRNIHFDVRFINALTDVHFANVPMSVHVLRPIEPLPVSLERSLRAIGLDRLSPR